VPTVLDIHLVMDNYGTHKTPAIKNWLARHPHFHVHFTPTSASWLNQVERWFATLTQKYMAGSSLKCDTAHSVRRRLNATSLLAHHIV